MKRYVLTDADREKGIHVRREGHEARRMRRQAELLLLNKLYAELAMPEMYPEERR
jgi:hypothetical protein